MRRLPAGHGSSAVCRIREQPGVGCALIVIGLAGTIVATYVLIPAFGGRSNYY